MSMDAPSRSKTKQECPHPWKEQLTEADARKRESWGRSALNPDIRAYECRCGVWHIGKSRRAFDKRVKRAVHSGSHKHWVSGQRGKRRKR